MISCRISAGEFFSKEGKPLGALLHGRARALSIPWPSPIAFGANTFASGQGGRDEQGRGSAASFAQPGLFLCTLSPGLSPSIRPSIPPSLPAGLRQAEARGQPLEQEPAHTSSFQPRDVSL